MPNPYQHRQDLAAPTTTERMHERMTRAMFEPPRHESSAQQQEIESLQRRVIALEATVARLMQWQLDDVTARVRLRKGE